MDVFFIPPIRLSPSDAPLEFLRLQFPIKLCFATTINKAQGQSFQVVGLDPTQQVFTHGQLYGNCSRVGNPESLFFYTENEKLQNVVYQEALQ